MSNIKDGGPIHPVRLPVQGGQHVIGEPEPTELHTGMSLRDYFAAKMLPLIYADSLGGEGWRGDVAQESYRMADAMLAARDK